MTDPVEFEGLSRIGFGGYRVSADSAVHSEALQHALAAGCNLIDTAANYAQGRSEALVGQVLAAHPEWPAFVVTKGGYTPDGGHSMEPDFLSRELEASRQRLRRTCIDGYLLHNPEHYFETSDGGANRDEYYAKIGRAFEFLEDRVAAGAIRYYGVSSNTLALPVGERAATELRRVLAAAHGVAHAHHFSIVEFPFNLLETGAATAGQAGDSLVETIRAHGLVSVGNRPLNAMLGNGMVRLATYEDEVRGLEPERDALTFADCVRLVRQRLEIRGATEDVMDFSVMQYLRDSWMAIRSPDAVELIFRTHFFPFLDTLYDGDIPAGDRAVYGRLYHTATLYAKKLAHERALSIRRELEAQGIISPDDKRALAVIACEKALAAGIDHVLVGMRSPQYVDMLQPLF